MAQSSCEAEWVAAAGASKEAIFLARLSKDFSIPKLGPSVIKCDSKNATQQTVNAVDQRRCRHITLRQHFIRRQCHLAFRWNRAGVFTNMRPARRCIYKSIEYATIPLAALFATIPLYDILISPRGPCYISTLFPSYRQRGIRLFWGLYFSARPYCRALVIIIIIGCLQNAVVRSVVLQREVRTYALH